MKNIDSYLNDALHKWGDKPYISTKKNGIFCSHSFAEVINDVRSTAKALYTKFRRGSRIMLYSENSYEWMIIDLASMGYGNISVPTDKEWTAYDLENVLNFIEISAVFYSEIRSEAVNQIKDKYPKISFFCIEREFKKFLESGKDNVNEALVPQDNMNETVKIIFTSGTTSTPKAIPLTQANLFNNWNTLFERTPMTDADKSCVFLPLNHVYSGVANFLYSIISGMQLYISANISEHMYDIIEVRPTVVCTVPLLLKKMYQNMTPELLDALRQIRFLYCGGSFTELEIKRWFRENGVNLLEAYGTTETSSVIALDRINESCLECNGTVFENLDVKILEPDDDGYGEILVKGGSRTAGYINCPHNVQYFDNDGYFHTGDLGKLDDQRRLYLRGRKKRMLETSDGKNVYADEIEELLLESCPVSKVRVYLEEYKIAALVYSLSDEKEVRAAIDKVNDKLPSFKKIKRIYVNKDEIGSRIK